MDDPKVAAVLRIATTALCIASLTASPNVDARAARSEPELIAPGVISTVDDEFGFVVAPDGRRALFVKRTPTTNTPPSFIVCETSWREKGWGAPRVAAFSGRFNDLGLAFAPDGRLFFTSNRPHDDTSRTTANFDIWVVAPTEGGWGTPLRLDAPVNTAAFDGFPAVAADGTLYLSSSRPGGKGGLDLYRARPAGGSYGEPENLATLNTDRSESQPAIAPDQSLLVFTGTSRHDMLMGGGAPYPRSDLYVAQADSGSFRPDVHLAGPINSFSAESHASFSSDNAWLYFASDRGFVSLPMAPRMSARAFERGSRSLHNGFSNVYRVPTSALRAAVAPR